MKKKTLRVLIISAFGFAALALIAVAVVCCVIYMRPVRMSVDIEDTNDVLLNPGKGFFDHQGAIYKEDYRQTVKIDIGDVESGTYKLAFGLFRDENDENPTYLLGSSGKTENNWYVFGETTVLAD